MNKLLGKMKRLKKSMQNVAVEMDYYGGFDSKMISHSAQLSGAARILQTWIDGIKKDSKKSEEEMKNWKPTPNDFVWVVYVTGRSPYKVKLIQSDLNRYSKLGIIFRTRALARKALKNVRETLNKAKKS